MSLRRGAMWVTAGVACATLAAAAGTPREGDVRFKVTCQHSHTLADDPIVYPNQPGASHLHDFNGNRLTAAATTTYEQLEAGTTTCNDRADLAGYWTPQVKVNGQVRTPTSMTGYYRCGSKVCTTIQPYPDGLKIVAEGGTTGWQCDGRNASQPSPDGCRTNLTARVEFPDCWNGRDLDSTDHRSHMAYAVEGKCPTGYPVPVPELTTYTHFGDLPAGAVVTLSSVPVGLHGDFFNGWASDRQAFLVEECLVKKQRCESGGP